MEKWVRGLSKTTALIFGILGIFAVIALYFLFDGLSGGFIEVIIFCAILGGGIGFSFPLIYKGITGQTPLERKESQQKDK